MAPVSGQSESEGAPRGLSVRVGSETGRHVAMLWSDIPSCPFAAEETPAGSSSFHRMASSLAVLNTEDLIAPKMCRLASA